jgi:hypothetical protein
LALDPAAQIHRQLRRERPLILREYRCLVVRNVVGVPPVNAMRLSNSPVVLKMSIGRSVSWPLLLNWVTDVPNFKKCVPAPVLPKVSWPGDHSSSHCIRPASRVCVLK